MAAPAALRVSPQEYLRQERARTVGRAELLDGEIVMMAGATKRHNRLTRNVLTTLDRRLGDGPCEALAMDMRVKAEAAGSYTYADVVVACEDAEFEDREEDTLTNPIAIFEVLSPSTRSLDRGDKFAYYRTIPSCGTTSSSPKTGVWWTTTSAKTPMPGCSPPTSRPTTSFASIRPASSCRWRRFTEGPRSKRRMRIL